MTGPAHRGRSDAQNADQARLKLLYGVQMLVCKLGGFSILWFSTLVEIQVGSSPTKEGVYARLLYAAGTTGTTALLLQTIPVRSRMAMISSIHNRGLWLAGLLRYLRAYKLSSIHDPRPKNGALVAPFASMRLHRTPLFRNPKG